MAFIRHTGRTKLISVPVTVSTAMSSGTLCVYTASTLAQAAASNTTTGLVGILRKEISPNDSDYATARSVLVEVPLDRNVEWEAATTGSAAPVGTECDISDSKTVDLGNAAQKVFLIRSLPSSTKAIVLIKFNGTY